MSAFPVSGIRLSLTMCTLPAVDGSSEGFRLGGLGVLDRPKMGGRAEEGVGSRGRSAGRPSGRASNVVPAPPRKTLTPLPPAESDLEEDLEEEKTRAPPDECCAPGSP